MNETIFFQFLGSDNLYTLTQVRKMIHKNTDLLFIVYQSKRGSPTHDNGHAAPLKRIGLMDRETIEQKFG